MGSVDVILFVRIFLYVANDLNDANAYMLFQCKAIICLG